MPALPPRPLLSRDTTAMAQLQDCLRPRREALPPVADFATLAQERHRLLWQRRVQPGAKHWPALTTRLGRRSAFQAEPGFQALCSTRWRWVLACRRGIAAAFSTVIMLGRSETGLMMC